MDCNFGSCRKRSEDQYTCDNCYIPKYCSEQCKRKDKEPHEAYCSPRTFVLKDFIQVKTSRKILDVGTYGEVQLMQNMSNNKLYAMKVIRKSLANEVIPLKVLFREIMIHKTLIHPNIVRLVDHFEDTTRIYIILEFVEKGSLFDLIRRKIKLAETEACEILIQTCTGLNYLHEKEIIHRDIKPENILISKEDIVKICDFGWSTQGNSGKLTFCGTLDYLSPEMINSEPHTTKMDVWALGILLYEMLHGSPPFRGKNPKEQYRLISSGNLNIGSHVSKSAAGLIRSILQVRPEARPSVQDVLRSQWVQEYSDSKLHRDWRVNDLGLGDGIITGVQGKIAFVSFRSGRVPMIENDVFRKNVIYDENNRIIWTPPEDESQIPRFDQNCSSVLVGSLYRKLGIDSGRATPISGRATPTGNRTGSHSRNDSRKGTMNSPGYLNSPGPVAFASRSTNPSRAVIETSPPLTDRPPRTRQTEEVKRSQPVLRKELNDFNNIQLSPEPTSPSGLRVKPKSSFLTRFKAK
jgi:serine/threonine protein kinase